jgi:hypothetical protein
MTNAERLAKEFRNDYRNFRSGVEEAASSSCDYMEGQTWDETTRMRINPSPNWDTMKFGRARYVFGDGSAILVCSAFDMWGVEGESFDFANGAGDDMLARYNGWTNHATWKVWSECFDGIPCDNIASAKHAKKFAESFIENAIESIGEEFAGSGDADTVKGWAKSFLSSVNWDEIFESLED